MLQNSRRVWRPAARPPFFPETPGAATVGGVLAAAISGYRRARYGPTRDRILEVTVVTGDGRIVKAGGRVVKNVTGYDLPRLVVGSLGSLGVIVSACLKLWPLPAASATITLDDPVLAGSVYRPLAVLSDLDRTRVFVAAPTPRSSRRRCAWVAPVRKVSDGRRLAGDTTWSLRVPPSMVDSALRGSRRGPIASSRCSLVRLHSERTISMPWLTCGVGRVDWRKTGAHQGTRVGLPTDRSMGNPSLFSGSAATADGGVRSSAGPQPGPASRGDLT